MVNMFEMNRKILLQIFRFFEPIGTSLGVRGAPRHQLLGENSLVIESCQISG